MKNKRTEGYPLNHYYSKIYKRYDLVNRLFTFGQDMKWRSLTAEQCLIFNPKSILDLCCGTGDLAILLNRKSGDKIQIFGLDFNRNMLDMAKKKAEKWSAGSIKFVQGNVAQMPFGDKSFDCITIGFGFRNLIFDNAESSRHISEIYRVLKPDSHLLILESAIPENSIVRVFYKIYLRLFLIPLGAVISGNYNAYSYLARSSANFYSISEMNTLMDENRFTVQSVRSFFLGAVNLIVAKKE